MTTPRYHIAPCRSGYAIYKDGIKCSGMLSHGEATQILADFRRKAAEAAAKQTTTTTTDK